MFRSCIRHHYFTEQKNIYKWANKKSEKEKVVIAYSLTSYTLKAMQYIKSINSNIKTAVIVPDLPQFTYRSTDKLFLKIKNNIGKRNVLRNIDNNSKYVDLFILFSEHMRECLPNCKHFLVCEGVSTDCFSDVTANYMFPEICNTVFYAGGLNKAYGIDLLMNAIELIQEKNYRFIFAGSGDMQKLIEEKARSDERIVLLGNIDRKECLAIEKGADLLINPRPNNEKFTRYSFPSKNMEYLSSGRPMVGYKLDGIPDVYDKYINYFQGDTPQDLANEIVKICDYDRSKALERAAEGQQFVLTQKNKYTWAKIIINEFKN